MVSTCATDSGMKYVCCVLCWETGTNSVLAFLRAQLRKAEPCRLLKMLVVGPPRQGKSALVEALLTGKASPFTPSEGSISTFSWELEKPNAGKNNVRKMQRTHNICLLSTQHAHRLRAGTFLHASITEGVSRVPCVGYWWSGQHDHSQPVFLH